MWDVERGRQGVGCRGEKARREGCRMQGEEAGREVYKDTYLSNKWGDDSTEFSHTTADTEAD